MNLAYENVKEVECLDISRDQLGTAKNAAGMFRIFSRFNALLVRLHIRGAIREYQTQLIHCVKDDIQALHDNVGREIGLGVLHFDLHGGVLSMHADTN